MPAVLFDFDGVISDSIAGAHRGICKVCRESGVPEITLVQFVRTFHAPYLEKYRALGITASYEQISAWYHSEAKHEDAPIFSDVVETLDHLAEHRAVVGIISAQCAEIVRRICQFYGIHLHIQFLIGRAEDKVAALNQFCKDFWYIPRRKVFFVGDFVSDMRDARLAGVHGIGITRGHPTRDVLLAAGAEVCIDHLTDLPAVTCCRE